MIRNVMRYTPWVVHGQIALSGAITLHSMDAVPERPGKDSPRVMEPGKAIQPIAVATSANRQTESFSTTDND